METIFQNTAFVTGALTGLSFMITAFICKRFPPKKINHFIGYRTKQSMESQEKWDFAQAYWPKEMLLSSFLLIELSSLFLILPLEETPAVFSVCMLILMAAFYPIVMTELALKSKLT